jgi:hypothetical protein
VIELLPWVSIVLAGASGFLFCRITHRQRGIEVDPWEQVKVPDDPSGIRLDEPVGAPRW